VDVVASPALGGVLAGFAVAAALGRRFVFTERAPGGDGRAMVLRRGQWVAAGERVLIVEDVITTGGSAAEVAALVQGAGATVAGVACLVDRSAGVSADQRLATKPVTLLATSAAAWDPQACPLCEEGVPLDSPGSRHRSSSSD
jgi:orotate phosphoribosyltransferase